MLIYIHGAAQQTLHTQHIHTNSLADPPINLVAKGSKFSGILTMSSHYCLRFLSYGPVQTLCHPKDQGGFGIHDLKIKNIALLSKWLYRLLTKDGIWQQLIKNKYLGSQPLSQVQWKYRTHIFG